ncbi:2,3-diaminopropionate biosynthesis protein SbnA [Paenibacillus senegalensis]|uniref:2,3-diaminopropionate biosynthesis protein SbnA n=1 Tax=Paenibacillus senegalensis TaxID=1465766 RepID=UPI000289CF8C|nr:2,3-diaminopropionate biosynthesis protein SbnA [Paenibacillus senegalensis]
MIRVDLTRGIASTIGSTPLVELKQLFAGYSFTVYGKLEWMNPAGSAKDRPAKYMLQEAIRRGEITQNTVVIESSSGNLGISLAQLCCYLELRFICVIDPRTTKQHRRIIESFGGELELVQLPDRDTGEYLPARIQRVQELLRRFPDSYWTNQYENPDNYKAHKETMMPEIAHQLGQPDYMICGVSSCGTIRGIREYIEEQRWDTQLLAVDAVGSVIFGGPKGSRKLPGLGAGIVPRQYKPDIADQVVYVTDMDCVKGCRDLMRHEAILAGASSGGVISAVQKLAHRIPSGAKCVVLLPDRGERYLNTIYDDQWVQQELGFDRPFYQVGGTL